MGATCTRSLGEPTALVRLPTDLGPVLPGPAVVWARGTSRVGTPDQSRTLEETVQEKAGAPHPLLSCWSTRAGVPSHTQMPRAGQEGWGGLRPGDRQQDWVRGLQRAGSWQ